LSKCPRRNFYLIIAALRATYDREARRVSCTGTTRPLELFGAADLDARALLRTMETHAPEWLRGCRLLPLLEAERQDVPIYGA